MQVLEMRLGTVVSAASHAKARTPAYVMQVDLGEAGMKMASA